MMTEGKGSAVLLGSLQASFGHGLLVVAAPESTDPHDGWDGTELIHAGRDSLYIGVQQAATGLVKVTCYEGAEVETTLTPLFTGRLVLSSARLELYDPDETVKLVVPVSAKSVDVTVYCDDDQEPADVLIQLIPIGG